ncbi:hypothetical protein EE612_046319 [Oryza sativa]|nr:hypothetical protein EE612_046319 [Oryza sativa]
MGENGRWRWTGIRRGFGLSDATTKVVWCCLLQLHCSKAMSSREEAIPAAASPAGGGRSCSKAMSRMPLPQQGSANERSAAPSVATAEAGSGSPRFGARRP